MCAPSVRIWGSLCAPCEKMGLSVLPESLTARAPHLPPTGAWSTGPRWALGGRRLCPLASSCQPGPQQRALPHGAARREAVSDTKVGRRDGQRKGMARAIMPGECCHCKLGKVRIRTHTQHTHTLTHNTQTHDHILTHPHADTHSRSQAYTHTETEAL